jgi:hypothetical protein
MADENLNATEEEELDALEQLLRGKLIKALQADSPSAALLAVTQKFLATRQSDRPAPARAAVLEDIASQVPFPTKPRGTARQTEALSQPWATPPRPPIGAPHDD